MSTTQWQKIEAVTSAMTTRQQQWLIYAGSLTKRLRSIHGGEIAHRVQPEVWGLPEQEEAACLDILPARARIRETDWHFAEVEWVATRTIIPATTLQGEAKRLDQIGHQSLGDLLFADPHLKRSTFEAAELPATHLYLQRLSTHLSPAIKTYWARRSVFFYFNQPLLVIEIFFPPVFTVDPPL